MSILVDLAKDLEDETISGGPDKAYWLMGMNCHALSRSYCSRWVKVDSNIGERHLRGGRMSAQTLDFMDSETHKCCSCHAILRPYRSSGRGPG